MDLISNVTNAWMREQTSENQSSPVAETLSDGDDDIDAEVNTTEGQHGTVIIERNLRAGFGIFSKSTPMQTL